LWEVNKVSDPLGELIHLGYLLGLEAFALRKVKVDGDELSEEG
jgi:hypothetical protein